jgi:hypothetical protein
VERGADVNKSTTGENGDTPLTLASLWGNVEVVRALLEAGADVNKRNGLGRSPLYYALKEETWYTEQRRQAKAQVAALLREAGAQEQKILFSFERRPPACPEIHTFNTQRGSKHLAVQELPWRHTQLERNF